MERENIAYRFQIARVCIEDNDLTSLLFWCLLHKEVNLRGFVCPESASDPEQDSDPEDHEALPYILQLLYEDEELEQLDLTHLYRSNSTQSFAGYIASSDSLSESSRDSLNSVLSIGHMSEGYTTDCDSLLEETENGRLSPHTTNLVREQLDLAHSEDERKEKEFIDGVYNTYGECIDYLYWNLESESIAEAAKLEPGSSEDYDSHFGGSALIREYINLRENQANEQQREIENQVAIGQDVSEYDRHEEEESESISSCDTITPSSNTHDAENHPNETANVQRIYMAGATVTVLRNSLPPSGETWNDRYSIWND